MTYRQDSKSEFERDNLFREYYAAIERKNLVYKKCSLVLLLVLLIFLSYGSSAAQCGVAGSSWESNGDVYQSFRHVEEDVCSDTAILTSAEFAVLKVYEQQNTQFSEITGEMASASFTFGMTGYLVFWFIGYKGRMAKQLIRQV